MTDIIFGNPLALLTSAGPPGDSPYATHLPVIPDPAMPAGWADEAPADLGGITLLGHLNRANPHWRTLTEEVAALLVFTGPHGYVSPTVYEVTPAAPTWNFTAVHVHGALTPLPAGEDTLEVVKATVRAFEKDFGNDWDMAGSIDYFRKILPAVGAFRFTVRRAEGMFKLSQEQKPEIRERVRCAFLDDPGAHRRETAALMSRLPHRGPADRTATPPQASCPM
jgi:transcriptional regulator